MTIKPLTKLGKMARGNKFNIRTVTTAMVGEKSVIIELDPYINVNADQLKATVNDSQELSVVPEFGLASTSCE